MDSQIIPRATIRAKGARIFDARSGINDHGMNHGAPAIPACKLGWLLRHAESMGWIEAGELDGEVMP